MSPASFQTAPSRVVFFYIIVAVLLKVNPSKLKILPYIISLAKKTLVMIPTMVEKRAPASVYLVLVTFAAIK